MPRTKGKPKTVSISKQRAQEDVVALLQDAQKEIAHDRWQNAHKFMQEATLLSQALVTMPARVRKITKLPTHDVRYSQSLEKGLTILSLFTPNDPIWGIADVADHLDISRSTTHRYMMSLVGLGQLEQTAGRKYRLVEA